MPPFEQRRPRFNHRILCSLSDSLIQFFGSLQHCRFVNSSRVTDLRLPSQASRAS
jgi:hypothetical protein